jgi:hypothetical protein
MPFEKLMGLLRWLKGKGAFNKSAAQVSEAATQEVAPQEQAAAIEDVQEAIEEANVRGARISREEFDDLARAIVFGEVSNRSTDKKDLEARVILNTAINRVIENQKRGRDVTLSDILTAENQYQAYGDKEQFDIYRHGGNFLDNEKRKEVDGILDNMWAEMKTGTFKDNTNNAFYYHHNPDGTIEYDDTRPLFAD